MTAKQKQCLLAYLGYYTGQIDGQWGGMSTAACRAFQADYGLTPDGICGAMTQKMLVAAVGKMADYQIILNAAGWLEKGALSEDDLMEIQTAIDAQYVVEEPETVEETSEMVVG